MAITTGPKILVMSGGTQGDTYLTEGNQMLRMLQALVQANVIDMTDTPPATPADGDMYIVEPTGTGLWAGHDNAVAYWTTQDLANPAGVWEFWIPKVGWLLAFAEENGEAARFFRWDGTEWTVPRMLGSTGVGNFNGGGTPIFVALAPGFVDTGYLVGVCYDYPTVNPGILSIEYVSATQFNIHSSSATDASTVRYFTSY